MDTLPITIEADIVGRGRIILDGRDISAHVAGVQFVAAPSREATRVVLDLIDVDVVADIEGVVAVANDQLTALRDAFEKIDPTEIERAALEGLDYSESATQSIIDEVRRAVLGDPPDQS